MGASELTVTQDIGNLVTILVNLGTREFFLSVAGTFVGAAAAFLLQSKTEQRQSAIVEDTAITRAIQSVLGICITAFNLKKQFVSPKVIELNTLTTQVEDHHSIGIDPILTLQIRELLLTHPPLGLGNSEAFVRVQSLNSIAGRPIQCADELAKRCKLLDVVLETHSGLVSKHETSTDNQQTKIFNLLGLVHDPHNRVTDERFRGVINNLQQVTDDILFFGNQIAKDLDAHQTGWRNRIRLGRRMRLKFRPADPDLLPRDDNYRSWLEIPITPLE